MILDNEQESSDAEALPREPDPKVSESHIGFNDINQNEQATNQPGPADGAKTTRAPESSSLSVPVMQPIDKKREIDSLLEDEVRASLANSTGLQDSKPTDKATAAPVKTTRGTTPKRKRRKKAHDHPKRPLSAYNFYFRDERNKILKGSSSDDAPDKKTPSEEGNKIGFEDLAKLIGARWKETGPEERAPYEKMASEELVRYANEMKEYDKIHNGYNLLVQNGSVPPMTMNYNSDMTTFLPFAANNQFLMNNYAQAFNQDMMYPSHYESPLLMPGYSNLRADSISQRLHEDYFAAISAAGRNELQSLEEQYLSYPPYRFLMPEQHRQMMTGVAPYMFHGRQSMNAPNGFDAQNSATYAMPSHQAFSSHHHHQQQREQPFRATAMGNSTEDHQLIEYLRQLQENSQRQTEPRYGNYGSPNFDHR